jgi:hypothetical protein
VDEVEADAAVLGGDAAARPLLPVVLDLEHEAIRCEVRADVDRLATEPDRVAHELRDRHQGVLAHLEREGRKPLHERAPSALRGGGFLAELDRPGSGLVGGP